MTCLSEVLKFNEKFVTNNQFEAFQTSKFPNKNSNLNLYGYTFVRITS